MTPDPGDHFFWITSRAFGIVALGLVTLGVLLGLALSARQLRLRDRGPWVMKLHEAISLTALGAIALHGLLLLGDSYLSPSLDQLTIPFTLDYRPLWTGVGIVGGWLAMIVGLSFYLRSWIGPKLWRWLHRWSLGVYVLAMGHALGAGTDAGTWWFTLFAWLSIFAVVALSTLRFLPDRGSARATRSVRVGTMASAQAARREA